MKKHTHQWVYPWKEAFKASLENPTTPIYQFAENYAYSDTYHGVGFQGFKKDHENGNFRRCKVCGLRQWWWACKRRWRKGCSYESVEHVEKGFLRKSLMNQAYDFLRRDFSFEALAAKAASL